MCDIILHQDPIPLTRGQPLDIQQTFLLYLLDMIEEAVIIVGGLDRAGDVSPSLYMPQVKGNMVLVGLEVWDKSSLKESSDQQ